MTTPTTTIPTTSALDIEAIYNRYFEAWAACDADAIAELHEEDTQFWLHSGEQPVRGRAAVRDYFENLFATYDDFGCRTYRVFFGARHWVLDWALASTVTEADGKKRRVQWDCIDIITVTDGGLVDRKDTFVDLPQAVAALSPAQEPA